jgi:hypothetical protein
MAALSAEANSLAGSLEERVVPVRRPNILQQARSTGKQRGSHQYGRRLRFASADEEYEYGKATTVESATDEDDKGTSSARQHARSAKVAKRRFDEVVARSRHERDAAKQAQEHMREAEEEDKLSKACVQADQLFSLMLQQKSLQWWTTLYRRHAGDDFDATQLYKRNVTSKAMAGWQRGTKRHHNGVEIAARIDVVRCKLNAWRTWTRRYSELRLIRREERKIQLRGAFEVTKARLEYRVLVQYYTQWKVVCIERRARRFRREHLLRGSMSLWRIHLWRSSNTRAMEVQVVQTRNRKEIKAAFAHWQFVTWTRAQWNVAKAYDIRCTTFRILDSWLTRSKERTLERRREAIADRWLRRRWRERALLRWRSKLCEVHSLEHNADNLLARRRTRIKAQVIDTWRLHERLRLIRRVQSSQLMLNCLEKWRSQRKRLLARLGAAEANIVQSRRERTLEKSFATWRQITYQMTCALEMSAKRDERKILQETTKLWIVATRRKREMHRRALLKSAATSLRRAFDIWNSRVRMSKLQNVVEERSLELVRKAFLDWSHLAARNRRDSLAIARFRGAVERRSRLHILAKWVQLVIDRKSLYLEAADMRDRQLLQRSWQHWLEVCVRHDDMFSLSNSFLDVKREDKLRAAFKGWLSNAQRSRSRRQTAERVTVEMERKRLVALFQCWYARYAEALLRPQELDWLFSRQEAVKAQVMDRWRAQTRILPAIELNHARLVSYALHFWRAKMPFARRERIAITHDRIDMQGKAFEHWKRMTKAKRAFRAAARFGGPSAARLRSFHRRVSPGNNVVGAGSAFGSASRSKRLSITRSEPRSDGPIDDAGQGAAQPTQTKGEYHLSQQHVRSDGSEPSFFRQLPSVSGRRWLLASSDAASESDVDIRGGESVRLRPNRFRNLLTDARSRARALTAAEEDSDVERSPSPASRTQSEATLRVRNSPRKSR